MSILELKNVSKSFGQLKVTDDVSFAVPQGQALGIIGPNGAGKSLLLRCLHGMIQPDAGEVRQGGRRLDSLACGRQAMVFQQPVLLRRTVQANLDYVLRRQGLSRMARAERCAELLDMGGLAPRARQWARSLGRPARPSGGWTGGRVVKGSRL